MSATLTTKYSLLDQDARTAMCAAEPDRFHYQAQGGAYLDLRGLELAPLPEIEEARIANLCRVVRGLLFAAVDGAQSGHPGGSSSKVEQVITLLASGALSFDAWNPKAAGRDRVVWSAGHCSPLFHALLALVYQTLRRNGDTLPPGDAHMAVYPEDLARFRRWAVRAATWKAITPWPIRPPVRAATASRRAWASPPCTAPTALARTRS